MEVEMETPEKSKGDHDTPTFSLKYICSQLFTPVDIASIVFFRILFGVVMVWIPLKMLRDERVNLYFVEPIVRFTYYGFEWVQPWPGEGMYWHFVVMAVSAVCFTVGFLYRLNAVVYFLGMTHFFLLTPDHYLNHYYFVCLLSFLMIFVPANRALSVDAWRKPEMRSDSVPAWALWCLCAQMGIVYFYGGLAKFDSDWLQGHTMRLALGLRTDFPLIGHLFTREWMVHIFSYSGLLIDLLVVPGMLWRKTRPLTLAIIVSFHVMNSKLFSIGIFPWLSIGATLLFFPPHWPRKLFFWNWRIRDFRVPKANPAPLLPRQYVAAGLLGLYLMVHLLVPLRHHLYSGYTLWTVEGHNFAWRMMLHGKWGVARFFVTDPVKKETWEIDASKYLMQRQMIFMFIIPDMIVEFSHHLADTFRAKGHEKIEVRATVFLSLNGRRPQMLIKPDVDLAALPRMTPASKWMVPFGQKSPPGFPEPPHTRFVGTHRSDLKTPPPFVVYQWFEFGMQEKDFRQKIEYFTKAIDLEPRFVKAYTHRGIAYTRLKKYELAIADYDKVLKLNPKNPFAYNNRGSLHSSMKNYETAIADFATAIQLHPKYATAYNNLGWLLIDTGRDVEMGIDFAKKALSLKPNNPNAMDTLGWGYYKKGQYKEAIEWLEKASRINPKSVNDHLQKARAALKAQKSRAEAK